jgi:hypothetical protein
MPERDWEIRKREATVEYRQRLTERLGHSYPLLEPGNMELLKRYEAGEVAFVSFDASDEADHDFRARIVSRALRAATDREDETVFSRHGAQHLVFEEAINKLQKAVENQQAKYDFDNTSREVQTQAEVLKLELNRLVIESPQYDRRSRRPVPALLGRDLRKEKDSRLVIKKLRAAAMDEDKGVGFAIIASLYAGMKGKEIMDILGNKDFNLGLLRQAKASGRWIKTVAAGRENDIQVFDEMARIVTIGEFSADTYLELLARLESENWLPRGITKGQAFGFQEETNQVLGRGVFLSMTEVAYRLADVGFKDPARYEYIDKLCQISTTRLITAFLVFD